MAAGVDSLKASVRQRADGTYQGYEDGGPLADGSAPYWAEPRPLGGIFADPDAAEAELRRARQFM